MTDSLATRAAQVRDATATNYNTAARVGSVLVSLEGAASGINPCDPAYGAVGTGLVDDSAALLLAIAAGVAAGRPVVGGGKTYGIAGNLTLVANAWLQDISFKQLTPAAGTVRTLTSAGGNAIKLENVVVNRNGDGTAGVHQVDAGVYISGGSGHFLEKVEVFGDDIGSGIALVGVSDSWLVDSSAHDIKYDLVSDPGNDRVQGVWLSGCSNVRLRNVRAYDIGGDFGGGYTLRYSRGFCFNGNTGVRLWGCDVEDVDQGYDVTGSVGNSRFVFDACAAVDCMTYGFKAANTARDIQYGNCIAERCGLSGFIASGPTGSGMTAVATSDITYTGCTAYDTGGFAGAGTPPAGSKIGFRASNGSFDLDTTLGIRWIGCKALDRQSVRTMANGFETDVAAPTSGNYNEAVNCVSVGNLGVAFSNLHESRCEVSRVAVQSIGTGSWTVVDWTAEVDLGAMHSNSSSPSNVYARREGNYRSTWGVAFAASATGQRGVRIVRNGTTVPGTTVLVDAAASGETALSTTWTSAMGAGDNLRIEVYQSSGGNLNLQTTSGGVVEQVG